MPCPVDSDCCAGFSQSAKSVGALIQGTLSRNDHQQTAQWWAEMRNACLNLFKKILPMRWELLLAGYLLTTEMRSRMCSPFSISSTTAIA